MIDINMLNDSDFVSAFEYRYDCGGEITKEMLDRYIAIKDMECEKK